MPWKTVARLALLLLSVALTEALELHIKAGPNGRVAGDCPFAHAIRIAAAAKSIDLNILPHGPTTSPNGWYRNTTAKCHVWSPTMARKLSPSPKSSHNGSRTIIQRRL